MSWAVSNPVIAGAKDGYATLCPQCLSTISLLQSGAVTSAFLQERDTPKLVWTHAEDKLWWDRSQWGPSITQSISTHYFLLIGQEQLCKPTDFWRQHTHVLQTLLSVENSCTHSTSEYKHKIWAIMPSRSFILWRGFLVVPRPSWPPAWKYKFKASLWAGDAW